MTDRLMPVGTKYKVRFPPQPDSTDPRASTITYRVREHATAKRFPGDNKGHKVALVDTVAIVKYLPELNMNGRSVGDWGIIEGSIEYPKEGENE